MTELNTFAERLSYALMVKGHSQRDLGRYIGSADTVISAYCLGKREPSARKMAKIAIFLDVSLDWLISGKGNIQDQFDYNIIRTRERRSVEIEQASNGVINLIVKLTDSDAKNIFHFLAKNA